MAGRGVRFTKAERALITGFLESPQLADSKLAKSALTKLDALELPIAKRAGISPQEAVAAFREVLGNRLVLPPVGAGPLWGAMGSRLKMLGLTVGDCGVIAKVAGAEWRGPIKAESLIRQADTLLQGAQQPMPWGDNKGPAGAVELGEDEI